MSSCARKRGYSSFAIVAVETWWAYITLCETFGWGVSSTRAIKFEAADTEVSKCADSTCLIIVRLFVDSCTEANESCGASSSRIGQASNWTIHAFSTGFALVASKLILEIACRARNRVGSSRRAIMTKRTFAGQTV